jgi:o-succinylbenzoate synthase
VHVGHGYRRVKLKIRPGWDVEPTRHVRASFPDIGLQVDANGAYDAAQAGDVFARLDDLGLLMIEQPFEETDLLAHAWLQQRLQTPVCLDESITTAGVAKAALALKACRVINIKVSRLGGLGPAREVHDVCRAQGVPAWCGGMHEFGVGRAANIALASLPGFTLPSDVSGSDKYFARDVVDPPVRAVAGRVRVPADQPGLGHEVIWSQVVDHVLRTAELAAGR